MNCCGQDEKLDPKKKILNARIDAIGWALFFIMIGILLLIPEDRIPETSWLIGAGLIMLGGNVVRRLYSIKMEGCTVVLGALALFFGISGVFSLNLPIFPILLILVGGSIVYKILFNKK